MSTNRKLADRLSFIWARQLHAQTQPSAEAPKAAMTIPHAARYLSTSVKFIRQLIWSRQIKYVKAGRRYVIAREELDRWLDENQRTA